MKERDGLVTDSLSLMLLYQHFNNIVTTSAQMPS